MLCCILHIIASIKWINYNKKMWAPGNMKINDLKDLLTGVYAVMLLKVTQLLEGLITITAMVLPSSTVYKVVLDQLLLAFETLEAGWTGKLAVHFINVLLFLCHLLRRGHGRWGSGTGFLGHGYWVVCTGCHCGYRIWWVEGRAGIFSIELIHSRIQGQVPLILGYGCPHIHRHLAPTSMRHRDVWASRRCHRRDGTWTRWWGGWSVMARMRPAFRVCHFSRASLKRQKK